MYPHGGAALTPSLSRPRVMPIPVALPVALHVNSSRKVHRSADGIINIIQEILFYAEGGVKSLAGKQLKEVHSDPPAQVRGRFSAETNARVFVGERLIRMHIQTAIRPNSSDSLEIDEVFHFAEHPDAIAVPIAFEATLEPKDGAAVEFDLSSPIVATLKQRIIKSVGEQYKVLQAIELRANEAEGRPTQELARKSTLTTPTNETAQFRERIFAGVDIVRVDRDINFICDRPILALSERREYIPEYPPAPRRRSSSVAPVTPRRLSFTPNKPRSRSQSRSWTDSENCPTAQEDLPTATSPYSLFEDRSPAGPTRTALGASPANSAPLSSDRSSRSKRKKWTVNSVVAKSGARTPERYDRACTMRNLSTARNLSVSPVFNYDMRTARASSPNGEIPAIRSVDIQPCAQLGPHGESQLVEGMEVLKVAGPADSLIRTGYERSPRRSSSDCSTAGEILNSCAENNRANDSPPYSPVRSMPRTGQSSRASTPMRTARDGSPKQQQQLREPSSAALNRRRSMFGHGVRPATTPTRSAMGTPNRRSPMIEDNVYTGLEASPMHTARKVVLSPVHTAVSQKELNPSGRSQKKGSACKLFTSIPPPASYRTSHSPTMHTAVGMPRNLFGIATPSESITEAFRAPRERTSNIHTARQARTPSRLSEPRSPHLATALARSIAVSPDQASVSRDGSHLKCPHLDDDGLPVIRASSAVPPPKLDRLLDYEPPASNFGRHQDMYTAREPSLSPYRAARSPALEPMTARSPAYSLQTGRVVSPRGQYPDLATAAEQSPSMRTARPLARSPYEPNVATAREQRSPARGLPTARQLTDRSPMLKTARYSPYDNVKTAREARAKTDRSPAQSLKTARMSPYDATKTARNQTDRSPMLQTARHSPYDNEKSARSPARGLPTARQHTDRSPMMNSPYSPYDNMATAREHRTPAREPATARQLTDRSPAMNTARQSPYGSNVNTARETRSPARGPPLFGDVLNAPPQAYDTVTAREARSPARGLVTARNQTDRSPMLKTARLSPYDTEKSARSPARGLPTARQHTDRSPMMKTARYSPYDNVATAREQRTPVRGLPTARQLTDRSPAQSLKTARQSPYDNVKTARDQRSPARGLPTARQHTDRSPMLKTARMSPYDSVKTARDTARHEHLSDGNVATAYEQRSPARGLPTARQHTDRSPMLKTARYSPYDNVATAREQRTPVRGLPTARQLTDRSPAQSLKTARQSPYDNVKTAREQRSPASGLPTARQHTDRSPMMKTARYSPYDSVKTSKASRYDFIPPSSPEANMATARNQTDRSPMLKTARHAPYDNVATAREQRSPARGLPTARQLTDRSPMMKTAAPSSPAPRSLYLAPEMAAENVHTAVEGGWGRSPARVPQQQHSLYLTPELNEAAQTARGHSPMAGGAPANPLYYSRELAEEPLKTGAERSPARPQPDYNNDTRTARAVTPNGEIRRVVTARVLSPAPRDVMTSPLHPTMTARDQTSGRSPMRTARRGEYDAPNSTITCVSGRSSNQNTARSGARSPMVYTSRAPSQSPIRTARMDGGDLTTARLPPLSPRPAIMTSLPSTQSPYTPRAYSPVPRTAIEGGGGMGGVNHVTNPTQSPSVYSSASGRLPSKSPIRSSNLITAQGSRSPHVDTESPNNLNTARCGVDTKKALAPQSPLSMRTGRERSRGPATASPSNLATAHEQRPASKSPAARQQRAQELLNTMPAHLKQEDSFSEQSQFTYQKTPSGGFAQKNTHSSGLITGQQRTPTKGATTQADPTLFYSARQTTPVRTLRPDDVKRTPTRDFSQHAGLESRSPLVRTAVHTTPLKQQQSDAPKCSLKSGCKATHEPRKIPVTEDSPSLRSAVEPKTPERSLRTARGPLFGRPTTPSAPFADMRTPRTAHPTASPASSLLKSPAPSSCVRTAMSPDAASNSAVSNDDVNTARRVLSDAPLTRGNWMLSDAAAGPTVAAASKPRVIVRANQADGKIHVEVCLSFKLNTTGTIRVRGEMVPQLHPRTVSVNGQQIWSDSHRQ